MHSDTHPFIHMGHNIHCNLKSGCKCDFSCLFKRYKSFLIWTYADCHRKIYFSVRLTKKCLQSNLTVHIWLSFKIWTMDFRIQKVVNSIEFHFPWPILWKNISVQPLILMYTVNTCLCTHMEAHFSLAGTYYEQQHQASQLVVCQCN